MCVICIKPAGLPLPDEDIIAEMWHSNPDGAGFMYVKNGKVFIEKGFMKLKSFRKRMRTIQSEIDTLRTPMVLHFRIGTAGGNTPANTHPFPVSGELDDLRKVRVTCGLGVVHNGIININTRQNDISDTMEYILAQLHLIWELAPEFWHNQKALRLIENQVQSKLAFLLPDGNWFTVGKGWIEDDKTGLYFSNSSYEKWYSAYMVSSEAYWATKSAQKDNREAIAQIPVATGHTTYEDTLVWLDPEHEYLVNDNSGDMIQAEGYLIDSYGELFYYDVNREAAVPVINHRVVPMDGYYTEYREQDAEAMAVDLDWDVYDKVLARR